MGNIFSAAEVVEFGIQIERNGADFYSAVASASKQEEVRGLFRFLADEEERHIALFRKIQRTLEEHEPAGTYPEEYFAYMNALAGDYVFTRKDEGAKVARAVTGDLAGIDMAVAFEKDSILFYQGMKRMVPADGLRLVDELIWQEEGHLRKLLDLRQGRSGAS